MVIVVTSGLNKHSLRDCSLDVGWVDVSGFHNGLYHVRICVSTMYDCMFFRRLQRFAHINKVDQAPLMSLDLNRLLLSHGDYSEIFVEPSMELKFQCGYSRWASIQCGFFENI